MGLWQVNPPWLGGYWLFVDLYNLLNAWDRDPDNSIIPDPAGLLMVGHARLNPRCYRPMNEPPGGQYVEKSSSANGRICLHFEQIRLLAGFLGISGENLLGAAHYCGILASREDVTQLCEQGRIRLLDAVDDPQHSGRMVIERLIPLRACEVVWMTIGWAQRWGSVHPKEIIDLYGANLALTRPQRFTPSFF